MKRWKIVRFAKFMDQKRTFESLEMTNKLLWKFRTKNILWEREREREREREMFGILHKVIIEEQS